jgi:hypothetical protein
MANDGGERREGKQEAVMDMVGSHRSSTVARILEGNLKSSRPYTEF